MILELVLKDGDNIVLAATVQTQATQTDFQEVSDAIINNLDISTGYAEVKADRYEADAALAADATSRAAFVFDFDRWKEFLSTVPAFAAFDDSYYYLFEPENSDQTLLMCDGKDNYIARICDVPKFLASIEPEFTADDAHHALTGE